MKLKKEIFAAFLFFIVSSTASAQIQVFQGGGDQDLSIEDARNAFLAATSTTVEEFETAFDPATSIDFPVGGPKAFDASSPIDLAKNSSYAISGTGTLYNCGEADHTVTFSFVSPITAFGVDIRDVADGGNILMGELDIGESGEVTTLWDTYHNEFFGIVSTTPFSTITFTWTGGTDCVYWEDLRYGAAGAASPIPTLSRPVMLLLMLLTGLVGLFSVRRLSRG